MKKIAIALVLGAFLAVGCGDKTGGSASGSAKASTAAAKDSGKASTTGEAKSSGSKSCDDYWTKLKACNENALKDVPDGAAKDTSKKAMEDAEKQTKEAWAKMEGAALEGACKQMLDSLAQNPTCPK